MLVLNNMIYLDHNATTIMHPEIIKKMQEIAEFGPLNPSSIHSYGRKSKGLIELARKSIASLLSITNDNFRDY